jgi:serine/threonine-protein kinase HipA
MIHADSLDVHVDLAGQSLRAGRAHFHRSRGVLTSTTFQYDAGYLSDARAYALDPALPLVSGSQQVSGGLPGAFNDTAPDRWGRGLIARRERAEALAQSRQARSLDDADFLTDVSDATRQGALRFGTPGDAGPGGTAPDRTQFQAPGHAVPKLVRLPALLRAADAVSDDRAGDDDFGAIKALLSAGSGSLGGARPKASVLADDDTLQIAKFPHRDDQWDVMAWEATALQLAELAGVSIPDHRLVRVGRAHVLLLRRFDRAPSVNDQERRIGYISAMTLLEHRDGEGADYVEIAEQLPEVSADSTQDARELFLRAALNVGLNNTDDHLRNHGFLRVRGGWTLSPAFDINPNPEQSARQTTIAGSDDFGDAADGLRELGRACRLAPAEIDAQLTHVAEALRPWREIAARHGVPAAELSRFATSFELGAKTLQDAALAPAAAMTIDLKPGPDTEGASAKTTELHRRHPGCRT